MPEIRIRWRQEACVCELRFERRGPRLLIYIGNQLVREEPVASALAAYQLASDLANGLDVRVAAQG